MSRKAKSAHSPVRPRPAPARRPASDPDGAGLAARRAALALVRQGLARRGGFDEALSGGSLHGLDARDRAFARALAAITFRRLGPIDRVLAGKLQRTPPDAVIDLLRVALAQVLFMDTPPHAAVFSTVSQAEQSPETRPFKSLVNAVLRAVLRDRDAAQLEGGDPHSVLDLSPEAHAPPWLFARWKASLGEDAARAIAARISEEPPTDLSLLDPASGELLSEALEGRLLPGGTLRTSRRGDVSEWPGFVEGRWWVQDASAAIAARLLHVGPGQTVLDICAAPGGKTLQLAAAGAEVTALDRSGARLARLSENLARMQLRAEVIAHEAVTWPDPRRFDAVLVDAPCSATGTFRRHPDVLWAAKPGDLARLTELQTRLLDAAASRVAPGGLLVYSVCSLEPEEGEAQAAEFLERRPEFHVEPVQPGECGAPAAAITAEGCVRIHPGLADLPEGADGFFVARVRARG